MEGEESVSGRLLSEEEEGHGLEGTILAPGDGKPHYATASQ